MVAEAAVVGISDELTGQAVNAFVSLKNGNESTDQVRKDLVMQVRKSIGPFAAPKAVFVVDDLPKTRSGKIMRRILRKILSGEEDSLGDTSTVCSWLLDWRTRFRPQIRMTTNWAVQLSDPGVVDKIIETVHASRK
jgi:acetyl-CoA synthetase